MKTYKIIFDENPAAEALQILGDGIEQFTQLKIGNGRNTPLTFFLRDEKGGIVGGVHGNYGKFGWLYISTLWVSEPVRGRGYGVQLMNHIERAAIEAGCIHAYLDTFSFQAPAFYKKLGYTVFGELEDFPVGHSRCFLRKRLIQPEG
ncbi:MAG: GNAT family N-acetyltransferase [Anaerolineales bacterium]|nr:GNAT family N-acetyltransferase [Anaerolineales bacterium]